MRITLALALLATACTSSTGGDDDDDDAPACTAADQEVDGTELEVTTVEVLSEPASCSHQVLTSSADVEAAFPGDTAPAELTEVDFGVDRVVLALSNPDVRFIVDDGAQLILGEEQLCQGAAPSCRAHVAHGTTRNTASVSACPYTGPDPCLAP